MALLAALVAAAAGTLTPQAPCADPRELAFVDVTVVRPESGRSDLHQTVIARCGTITAVGPSSVVRAGAGARRIDGRGKFLAPGLVDAHGHSTERQNYRLLYLAHGVTTVRNLNGNDKAVAAQRDTAAGRTPGPVAYLSGPIVYGSEPEWKGRRPIDAAGAIVGKAKADRYEYIKTYYQLTPPQFEALATATYDAGLTLVGHVPRSITLEQALAWEWSVEHLTGFDDALEDPARHVEGPGSAMLTLRRFAAADTARIDELAKRVARSRVWQVPTLYGYELWTDPQKMRELLDRTRAANLLSAKNLERWTQPNPYYIPQPDQQTDADRAAIAGAGEVRRRVIRALHDAGAQMAIGTDAGAEYLVPGLSFHEEIRAYQRAGIPAPAILQMATTNGAKITRHDADFGTIDVGKRADLLLLVGDPFSDLGVLERPAAVIAAGRYYARNDLDAMIDRLRTMPADQLE